MKDLRAELHEVPERGAYARRPAPSDEQLRALRG